MIVTLSLSWRRNLRRDEALNHPGYPTVAAAALTAPHTRGRVRSGLRRVGAGHLAHPRHVVRPEGPIPRTPPAAQRFGSDEDEPVLRAGTAARARGHYTRAEFITVCAWKTPRSRPRVQATRHGRCAWRRHGRSARRARAGAHGGAVVAAGRRRADGVHVGRTSHSRTRIPSSIGARCTPSGSPRGRRTRSRSGSTTSTPAARWPASTASRCARSTRRCGSGPDQAVPDRSGSRALGPSRLQPTTGGSMPSFTRTRRLATGPARSPRASRCSRPRRRARRRRVHRQRRARALHGELRRGEQPARRRIPHPTRPGELQAIRFSDTVKVTSKDGCTRRQTTTRRTAPCRRAHSFARVDLATLDDEVQPAVVQRPGPSASRPRATVPMTCWAVRPSATSSTAAMATIASSAVWDTTISKAAGGTTRSPAAPTTTTCSAAQAPTR